jgi:hypothetical protein
MLSPTLGRSAGAVSAHIVLMAIALSITGCTGSSGSSNANGSAGSSGSSNANGSAGSQVNRTSGHDTQRDGGSGMDHGSNGGGRY